jgi:hypothetical protein
VHRAVHQESRTLMRSAMTQLKAQQPHAVANTNRRPPPPALCSEPHAGSDVGAMRTTAERKGGCYVVNGQKKVEGRSEPHRTTADCRLQQSRAVGYSRAGRSGAQGSGATGRRKGGREAGRGAGRQGGREEGRQGGREEGRKGGTRRRREGVRDEVRERGRECARERTARRAARLTSNTDRLC